MRNAGKSGIKKSAYLAPILKFPILRLVRDIAMGKVNIVNREGETIAPLRRITVNEKNASNVRGWNQFAGNRL